MRKTVMTNGIYCSLMDPAAALEPKESLQFLLCQPEGLCYYFNKSQSESKDFSNLLSSAEARSCTEQHSPEHMHLLYLTSTSPLFISGCKQIKAKQKVSNLNFNSHRVAGCDCLIWWGN